MCVFSKRPIYRRSSVSWGRRTGVKVALVLLLSVLSGVAAAVQEARLHMESVQGEGWRGQDLLLELGYNSDDSLTIEAQMTDLFAGKTKLKGIRLGCPLALTEKSGAIRCEKASLAVMQTPVGKLESSVSLYYGGPDDWRLSLDSTHVMGGQLHVHAHQQSSGLVVDFSVKDLALIRLEPWLGSDWSLAGKLYGKGQLRLGTSRPLSLSLKGKLKQLSWSSADSLQVGEAVGLEYSLAAERKSGAWRGSLTLKSLDGQLYSDPVFLEIDAQRPLELSGDFELGADGRQLKARKLHARYARALELRGSMDMDVSVGELQNLSLDFSLADLQQTYQVLLQPLAIGTPMDDVSLQGRAQGSLHMTQGVLQSLEADLLGVNLEHNDGMFGISGLEANLDWQRQGKTDFSHLEWQAAHLYRIALGGTEALFQMNAGSLRLQPLSIPLLGGSLMLHDLEVDGLLKGEPAWETRADLEAIQLLELSRSMGWPDMQGSLQASIPRVYYKHSILRMQGQLKLDVFGGEVVFDGMELQDPLGVAPVLQTSLHLSGLDLQQITQVFAFGRIEGSLEGYVRNLQLVGWEVAAFDAFLHSPSVDKRPHRISQRAIDNLTELGNGASVQLSATMLRFFEDFAYDSLALQIKLHGATAELDGVPRSQGGYYIVKGARLPRIDVIGRNHRIAWKELLSRIRDIRFDDMIVE